MVPLYAARVQDLGPEDVAEFKCGACGHTAELPPSALIRGLGLEPTTKVLDLERRRRCRLCYAKNRAVVSIKWERMKRRSKLSFRWRIASLTKTIALSELRGSERHLKCIPFFLHLQNNKSLFDLIHQRIY